MRKYIADPVKLCTYSAAAVFLLIAGIGGLVYHAWIFAVIFLVSSGAFFGFSLEYASTLTLDETGVQRKGLFGIGSEYLDFEKIGEIGVVGTNPRNPKPDTGNKTGVLYIYFSPETLTESSRQKLTYNFPQNVMFLRYTPERYEQVGSLWNKEIKQYNTGCKVI